MAPTTVQVRSAIKLDSAAEKTIKKFASDKLTGPLEIETIIDPGLIAGFKLNISGMEYDYSLSGSLSRLAQEL